MQPLTGHPREGLSATAVAEALSLRRGATVRHGVDVLTSSGQATGATLRYLPSGSMVKWSYRAPDRVVGQAEGVAAVRRQATLVVPAQDSTDLLGRRLRIWTDWLLTDGTWARFYLGVFVIVNPGAVEDDGLLVKRTLQLADKSYLWQNSTLTEPLQVPAGTVPLTYVQAGLAARFGETSFALSGPDTALTAPRTFEAGTTWLEVWSRLLEAVGNEQLTADELGRPSSQPVAVLAGRGAEQAYGAGQGKVLEAGQVEPLLPGLPNVVRFSARQGPSLGNVEGNGLRTIRNVSTGPASITARGFEVEQRVEVDADSQGALDAIAYADAQRYFAGGGLRWQGRVGLNPRHSDRDVISLQLPRLSLDGGTWQVTEWSYPLGDVSDEGSVLMGVTAERRVAL